MGGTARPAGGARPGQSGVRARPRTARRWQDRVRHRGARLFLVYAAASLVPVSILGLALTRGYHDGGRTQALDQGLAQAAVIEQMAVAPALGGPTCPTG